MSPNVSIIMPVLNGQKYIGEAVQSIVDQTFKNFELVVVNDGSTDGTLDVLQPFLSKATVRFVHHPKNLGVARSVNDGIRNSAGRYITFLDHDDLWFPEFLEVQTEYLRNHQDVGMVHSDFQTIDPDGNIIQPSVAICNNRVRVSGHVFPRLFMDSFIVANSVLIRKECFNLLGGFDENLPWGDYHMWMRIARHYKIDYVPRVLTKYRQHSNQNSRQYSDPNVEPPGLAAIRSILEMYPEVKQELGDSTINRRTAILYFDMAYFWFRCGGGKEARVPLLKAIRLWPTNPVFYRLYAATFLGPAQADAARRACQSMERFGVGRQRTVSGL
jgi:hypothetical protein